MAIEQNPESMPHDDAPLWVWHAWLCHGADPDGSGGSECPDGCYGDEVDYSRQEMLKGFVARWIKTD